MKFYQTKNISRVPTVNVLPTYTSQLTHSLIKVKYLGTRVGLSDEAHSINC